MLKFKVENHMTIYSNNNGKNMLETMILVILSLIISVNNGSDFQLVYLLMPCGHLLGKG